MNINSSSDISPNFCIMPWQGIATNPGGGFRPCCWMDSHFDTFKGPLSEYRTSDYLKNIKDGFLKGKYPPECKKCQWNDEKGITSKRLVENKKWENLGNKWESYDDNGFSIIDLRFSNVCNLGCIMCGPRYSSYLHQEIKNYGENIPEYWSYKSVKNKKSSVLKPYTDDDIDQIISSLPHTAQIYCAGGEPSLDKNVMRLLETLIEKGYNKTITLQFNSNFQSLTQKWVSMLKNFKGWMYPSIDGVGKVAEYIRYPCSWDSVEKNVRYFIEECGDTWTVNLMPTVSVLTIFNLSDIFEWEAKLTAEYRENRNLRVRLGNRLYSPVQFDICNLPNEAKQLATERCIELKKYKSANDLGHIDDIIKHLKPKCSFTDTVTSLDRLDAMRNTNWRDILSDLGKFA